MIKSTSDSSSTWSLALPPQYSLFLSNTLILINFIVALLVPWVEARYRILNIFFPVYVPIKMGLLKCFGDMCAALTGEQDQHQSGGGHHKKDGSGSSNSPPQLPGGWNPAGGTGGGGGGGPPGMNDGGGGGGKALFEVSAIFTVVLLSVAVLLALGGALSEAARIQGRHDISGLFPLQLSAAASLVCLVAVLEYLFITLAGLHGGHYEVGFWLTLGTAIVTSVLSFGQYLLNKSHFDEEHVSGEGLFHPSQFRRVDGSATAPSACKKGCCGGGGGAGGGGGQGQLVQPRPQYGAV